jgi:glutathione synthase/RimK-type ligase-like ATP-grasp enzyme
MASVKRVRVRVASCLTLPEPDPDAVPLADALARANVAYDVLGWEDPAVDWSAAAPTVIRSTWNYALDLDRYLAWIDRIAAAGPVFNPRDVVRDNLQKRYLLGLEARGVAIVPTTLVERGASCDLGSLGFTGRFVIKPEVGAGSLNARVFDAPDGDAAAHLAALTAKGAALVQPYMISVDDYGERSMIYIDGELSHAIRKSPRFAGQSEMVSGPYTIAEDERAVALAALAPYGPLLYARVDLARDPAGQSCVMELELVEPSLFFSKKHGSADRFVAGLLRRLRG